MQGVNEDTAEMFFHLAGDENVIKIHQTTVKAVGDFIHKMLEGLSSVPKSKGHPG